MDADIDWCLNCERRVDGQSLYCSTQCRQANDSQQQYSLQRTKSTLLNHTWRSIPDDDAAIVAWASQIPPGAPPASCSESSSTSSLHRPPALLSPCLPVRPSLSITPSHPYPQPTHTVPAQPLLLTPRRHTSSASIAPSGYASMGQTSLFTPASSIALATPPHASPMPMPIPIPTPPVTPLTLPHQHQHQHTTLHHLHFQTHHRAKPSAITDLFRSWAAPTPGTPAQHLGRRQGQVGVVHPIPVMHDSTGSDSQGSMERAQWFAYEQKPQPTPRGRHQMHDEHAHPSFRTRGRKTSRAAA